MGREDEGDRLAAERHRPSWRQGNRPERQPLPHPRRRIRQGIREASSERLAASLAIGTGRATGEGEESQQNEIHLPGLWTERMGEAGRAFRLLRLLRGTEELVLMLADPSDQDEAPSHN